jgi:hypothetical protein
MVSNFPRLFVAAEEAPLSAEIPQAEGFSGRVIDRVREAFCGLHGHDSLLQFQQDRMFLKCASCGHESPGWELNETPPTVVARVENRVQAVVRTQFIEARRIA